jgi:hypothetical protein
MHEANEGPWTLQLRVPERGIFERSWPRKDGLLHAAPEAPVTVNGTRRNTCCASDKRVTLDETTVTASVYESDL